MHTLQHNEHKMKMRKYLLKYFSEKAENEWTRGRRRRIEEELCELLNGTGWNYNEIYNLLYLTGMDNGIREQ